MRWIYGALAALPALVSSLAGTDSFRDVDLPQSGYLPNHNLDPNEVGSGNFRNLWSFQSDDNKELWLAKPLVYTPAGGSELLITSSEMNKIRVFDAKTGTLLQTRQLQLPFARGDANCGDIPDWIGITGTPIIDPNTDIMYVMSKGYREGSTSGTENGIYKMYAIRIPSLEDVEGFPTLIDGANADNDRARYFVGGVALQRPSLTEVNGHIVAGFGSHCGRWNYTGYLVAVSKQPGVGVTSMWATESAPGAPSPQPLDLAVEQGGKAGIWQSGFGLATVGNAVYFTTGNGQGMHNGNVPANGREPMSTLSHSTVRMELSADGKWSQIDYFQPYDYTSMNAGDRDVGSGGFMLLDPTVFKGTGVDRMGVIAGKLPRAYVLNANDLGGFRNGPGGLDKTIQTIPLPGATYGGFGSYPYEGGYIYVTTIGGPLQAYRLGHDSNGRPVFSLAGQTTWTSAGRVGVGQMTVTSNEGQPGTGIVWITDVTDGLRAFKAIPENGELIEVPLPRPLNGANKFQRPVFGNGRVYYQAQTHRLFCLGSPVAQALSCSHVDFGNLEIGDKTTATVSCTANAAINAITGCSVGNSAFSCDSASLPSGRIAAGSSFTFGVSWNLEGSGIAPGFVSSPLTLAIDAAAEFGRSSIVNLEGTAVSTGPYLQTGSSQAPFGTIVLFDDASTHIDASLSLENAGNATLTITGVAHGSGNFTDGDLGSGFTSDDFPAAGQTIAEGERINIAARFESTEVGEYGTVVTVWSDGGAVTLNLTAAVRSPPVARFEVSDGEGGWTNLETEDYSFNFGDVTAGESSEAQIRVCNDGGAAMTITISKPPDAAQLFAANPAHDLAEGVQVQPDSCEIGNIAVRSSPLQPNTAVQNLRSSWALTTDGLNATTGELSGLHDIILEARIVPRQLGPLLPDGMSRYQYVGCFSDTTLGRNLQTQVNTAAQQQTNTMQQCQTLCRERGFAFAATQYRRECWCGNEVRHPQSWTDPRENRCTFSCMGDDTQACGGDGGFMSLYADIEKVDIEAFLESIKNGQPPATLTTTATTSTAAATTSTAPATTTAAPGTTTTTTTSAAVPTGTIPVSPLNPSQPASVGNGQWEYHGCFNELVDNKRTLGDRSTSSDSMTPGACASYCSSNGGPYNYFGLTYGRECYCGWKLEDSLRAAEGDCSSTCIGGGLGLCGGFRKLSVFRNIEPSAPPAGPEHVKQIGDYTWLGCYTGATSGRALTGKTYASDDMSVNSCKAYCEADNFKYFGIEYSRECRCGNVINAGSVLTETSQCSMLCKGNPQQYCGAGSRLDMYELVPGSGATSSVISATTSAPATSSEAPSSTESSVASTTEDASSSEVVSSEVPSSAESSSEVPVTSSVESSAEPSVEPSSVEVSSAVSSEVVSSAEPSSTEVSSALETSSVEPSSSEASSTIVEVSSTIIEVSSTVSEASSVISEASSVISEVSSTFSEASSTAESSSAIESSAVESSAVESSVEASSTIPEASSSVPTEPSSVVPSSTISASSAVSEEPSSTVSESPSSTSSGVPQTTRWVCSPVVEDVVFSTIA